MTDGLQKMLSLAECRALIKEKTNVDISIEHLRKNILSGRLVGRKFGRGWRVAEADLVHWASPDTAPKPTRETPFKHRDGRIVDDVDYSLLMEQRAERPKKRR